MGAYFTRRIIAGVAKLGILSLVIFTMGAAYASLWIEEARRHCYLGTSPCPEGLIEILDRVFELEKPWPLNYLSWLFDPEDTLSPITYDLKGNPIEQIPVGVDIAVGPLQIKGSGALTGDLGPSLIFDYGTPVSDIFGPGIGEMFAFITGLIAALMALIAAQRWRRPQSYRASALPTSSALVDWWHLHANSPLDMAVVRRQIG